MRRSSSREIEVRCTGYASIDDFDTEALVEELNRRATSQEEARSGLARISGPDLDLITIHEMLRASRFEDATLALERFIWPKWRTIYHCQIQAAPPAAQKKAA